jgi:hypothetical protein
MMATLAELIAEIADDIDDTTGEYTAQTRKAILSAIRFCERKTYYFNQTRDVTFPTVIGQEWYGAADNANIPTLVQIQYAYLEGPTVERRTMRRVQNVDIEEISPTAAEMGEPYCWTYFDQQMRIYPIPGPTVYTVRLQLGPYRLATLVDDAETNAWLSEAYDMIKARAKYILQKDTLKDAALAVEALNDFNDQELALAEETSRRMSTGRIKATCF